MVATKDLCAFFFEPRDQGLYRCKLCGANRKQLPGTGYSNLMSHLAGRHDDYQVQGNIPPLPLVARVVMRCMPLSEVDDKRTRAMSKWRPTNSKALKADMDTVAAKMGTKIEEEMGILFGVMYDGWTHGTMHYVGVYGVYEINGRLRPPLLALSPLAQGRQDAEAHIELFRNVLAVYNKTLDMVQFFVSDNCNTNRSIATKLDVPLVSCASHRFNLAVNKFLTEHETLLTHVYTLMKQLRLPNNAAELKTHTHLRAKKRNVSRWSLTHEILEHYVTIRAKLCLVEAVEDYVPSSSEHKRLAGLLDHLKKFDSVCKHLQRDSTSLSEVRLLFDSILVDYQIMGSYLKSGSNIVHSSAFETGFVKVCSGRKLTTTETAALQRFECPQTPRTAIKRKEREPDYAAQLIEQGGTKRRRGDEDAVYSALVPLVPPTSNACERLFSECKVVLTPQPSSLLPANFEMLSFHRANDDMWNVTSLL